MAFTDIAVTTAETLERNGEARALDQLGKQVALNTGWNRKCRHRGGVHGQLVDVPVRFLIWSEMMFQPGPHTAFVACASRIDKPSG